MTVPRRREVERFHDEVEELFAELYQVSRLAGMRRAFRPAADCFRTEDPPTLTVLVDLAGVDPGAVQLAVRDRTLLVAGERRRPTVDRPSYQQMEIQYGRFERRIALADDVELARASASYERGILTIVLPVATKPPRSSRVSIEIRARA